MKDGEKVQFEGVRIRALNHLTRLLPIIKSLEEELEELKDEYKDYKEQYENADHALAEFDGRLKRIPTGIRGRKPVKLSLDQIKSIADKLGLRI